MQKLDEDSAFTYRKRETVFPRGALAEEVEAHILHLANKRFTARGWNGVHDTDDGAMADDEDDVKSDQSSEASSSDSDMEDSSSESGDSAGPPPGPRIVPTIDDDTSAAILKPAVGDIVSKLERTLTVLHNMMATTVRTNNQDDASDGEETGLDEPFPRARSRSRSRSLSKRVKRPRPPSEAPEVDTGGETPRRSPQKKPRHASASPGRSPQKKQRHASASPAPGSTPPSPASPKPPPSERILRRRANRLNRLAPRNWRDVLGAASLADFPPAALHRAAQRCADLFGGEMDVRVLNDHLPTGDFGGLIFPGGPIKLEEVEDDGEMAEVAAMRLAARDASRAEQPSRPASRTTSRTRRSQTPASPNSRSRSRSATPHLACPYRTCPRSVDPFSRRGNLVRHVELVHGGDGAGVLGMEVDSEDEVEGGVHVDGFLRGVR
ncbi:MAG: hypothetical protein IMZ46_08045, partial [Acidobacteria bacterium]|nr:hypothetical protein [Acidobacteriota bacterium]